MEGKNSAYMGLLGKSEVKRPLGRPRRMSEMDLREIRRDGIDWIYPSQYVGEWTALVNTMMNLRV
jgi:hypothetical protein